MILARLVILKQEDAEFKMIRILPLGRESVELVSKAGIMGGYDAFLQIILLPGQKHSGP